MIISIELRKQIKNRKSGVGRGQFDAGINGLKKTTMDMNTVACYMKDIGKILKVENLPAAKLDHLLSKFFIISARMDKSTSQTPSPTFSEVSKDI